jgi:hypothetical protein
MGEAVGDRLATVGAPGVAAPGMQAVKSRIKNVKEKTFGLRILIFLVFVRDGKKNRGYSVLGVSNGSMLITARS